MVKGWAALRALAVLLAGGLCAPSVALAATAYLERNPIHVDETVRLVIEVDRRVATETPDLRPLTRDFSVLGTSTSTNIEIVDGRQVVASRWLVELEPRRVGTLRVPAIKVAGASTPALDLEVLPAKAPTAGAVREVFLEVEASPAEPYVQAQVVFTVRLFLGVDVTEGSLSEPQATDALIDRLGGDASYEALRGGRRYRVVERRYVVFPQRSGELVLSPLRFEGRVASGAGLGSFFDRGRRVRARSAPVRIDVRPRPSASGGSHWLPAKELTLVDEWPDGPPRFRVGEPVTRKVTLAAVGLTGVQLPALAVPEVAGLRSYADQPETQTRQSREGAVGTRTQRIALVPSAAGTLTLPPIEVRWWDVDEDLEKIATIASRTIEVQPAAAGTPEAAVVAPRDPAEQALESGVQRADSPGAAAPPAAGERLWPAISAALLVAWLATALAWWRARRRPGPPSQQASTPPPNRGAARALLRQACERNDARAAAAALLDLAAATWPQGSPRSLAAIAAGLDDAELRAEIAGLDRALYGSGEPAWTGARLWSLASGAWRPLAPDGERAVGSALPPLRPEGA